MNRRIFLRNSISASMAPVFLAGFGNQMLNASVLPASFASNNSMFEDRCMVILYMAGGNDILNTVLADEQITNYQSARNSTELAITGNMLKLNDPGSGVNGGTNLWLHPKLGGLRNLYLNEKFKLIQRVGYDQVNGSHFSAESILLRGVDGTAANATEKEGWIARFLKDRYPQYSGVPYEDQLDPMGVVFSNPVKLGFHTHEEHNYHLSLTNQDAGELFNTVNSISGNSEVEPGDNCIHDMLQYASLIEKTTQVYSNRIQCVFDHGGVSPELNDGDPEYPIKPDNSGQTDLALQLQTVARLIKGGSKTKIFMVQVGGFDTHVTQLGTHEQLLKDVGDSLNAFQSELSRRAISHKVLTVAFSEFGRKIIDNGSGGTDHGTLSSLFVIGDGVPSGVLGSGFNLDINEATAINTQGAPNASPSQAYDQLYGTTPGSEGQMDYDYRSVYAQIIKEWFGADNCALVNTFAPGLVEDCRDLSPTEFSDLDKPSFLNPVLDDAFPSIVSNDCTSMDCTLFTPLCNHSLNLQLKVFLEGFMLAGNTQMNTNLAQVPTGGERLLPINQPYNSSQFKYFGEETTNGVTNLADMVDWLYIEIYESNGLKLDLCPPPLNDPAGSEPFSQPFGKKAVLVNSSGSIIDTVTNSNTVTFKLYEGTYKIAVYHRSHLGILIDQEITITSQDESLVLDLTVNGESKVKGDNQLKNLGGTYVMLAGDVDQNGVINNVDHNLIKQDNGTSGYNATDLDGDGTVNSDGNANNDLDLWKGNKSKIGEPLAHKLIK